MTPKLTPDMSPMDYVNKAWATLIMELASYMDARAAHLEQIAKEIREYTAVVKQDMEKFQ